MATPSSTPDVWAFLREIFARLGAKNPKFFNVFAWISAVATFITGLPILLGSIPGLVLPEAFVDVQNKVVAVAGMAVFIMSNLAVQRAVITPTGVMPGSSAELPFTEKKEAQKIVETQDAASAADTPLTKI